MKNIVLLACLVFGVNVAHATTLNFLQITNNGSKEDISTQLVASVEKGETNNVLISFENKVGIPSVVGTIYIQDNKNMFNDKFNIINTGVTYKKGTTPPVLPGDNDVNFENSFGVTAKNLKPKNGLSDIGDMVTLNLKLSEAFDYYDVLKALETGDLRFDMHVISIGELYKSESFVTSPVPLPATVWLMMSGLGLLGWVKKRNI